MVHLAPDPASAPRASATVKTVARDMQAHESVVRRLVKRGELEGYTLGTRGLRIFLDSVIAYQKRQARSIERKPDATAATSRRSPRAASVAAHRSAEAALAAAGCTRKAPWR